MTRVAWFHCFAGIAGDMALGSLIDAGADLDEVEALIRRLPVGGWEIGAETTQRTGLGATHLVVHADDDGSVVRTYSHITGLIEEARLPERVRQRAQAVFAALAEAESHLHQTPVAQIHFHEVGGLDAIIDIVGTCAALEILDIDEIESSPVAQGLGMVQSEHGMLPNPAPATLALLAARKVPTFGRDLPVELTTPTGAALLSALASRFGPMPNMHPEAIGYGAGTKVLDGLPNLVQVVIGERVHSDRRGQKLVVVEANVDDATGEVLAHTVVMLLEAGAADAWITPTIAKKGRPAHIVSALVDPAMAEQVGAVLLDETGSLGVRSYTVDRWASERSFDEVDVVGFPVRIKIGPGRAKPEFDDAAKVARRTGLPVREVIARAESAWRRASEVRQLHPAHLDDHGD